jgi:hypothetical protein
LVAHFLLEALRLVAAVNAETDGPLRRDRQIRFLAELDVEAIADAALVP